MRSLRGTPHMVGGTADHVHIFTGLTTTHCLANFMSELKSGSSMWISKELGVHNFSWQDGYGAFTVSPSHLGSVTRYVENQEEHHRISTFQEEYVTLLKRGLVEYDDEYLW